MTRLRLSVLSLALLSASLPARAATGIGPFTLAQVTDGRVTFMTYCSGCHGAALGGAQGAALVDAPFMADWADKSTKDILAFAMKNMPLNRGGTLKEDQYIQAIAFILAVNGAKPGPTPLTKDSDVRIGSIADGTMVIDALEGTGAFASAPVKSAAEGKAKTRR